MTPSQQDCAVVLGGSIAGLLAARVLTETHSEVVIVDRDPLGPGTGARRGTPQARHLHGLLARGHDLLEELFPGLTVELVEEGAPVGDMLANARVCIGGYRFRQGTSGLTAVCVSRPVLEAAIRRRVLAHPRIRPLGGRDVVGLATALDRRRVVGAKVIRRVDGSAEERLDADLVVDATGRGSRLPVWLEAAGYGSPARERLDVRVGYSSRRYRLDRGVLGDDLVVLSAPTPDRPRGGALSLIEGGVCLVTLMGVLGDHPPTDPIGFERFSDDLALSDVSEVLRDAQPLDEPVGYRYPSSVRTRYDRLDRFPEGLVVLGDAACTLNPIYGQGMTVAALEAVALRRHLTDGGPQWARGYRREVGRISGRAWEMAKNADLSFPQVPGRRTAATRAFGRYVTRLQAGAVRDAHLGAAFLRVTSMVDPPGALLRPGTVARAMASPGAVTGVDAMRAGSRG
jgi:2-polyprenyl-6-methoxyphenol hydroxylase-like FAD-dependent oxidoreductase